MELPEVTFFDDFYFWFNTETKKEYYATPLYFYKAAYHLDIENKLRDVYYKETEKWYTRVITFRECATFDEWYT